MTYLAKPRLRHPTLTTNKVGYTRRDYEGATLRENLYNLLHALLASLQRGEGRALADGRRADA